MLAMAYDGTGRRVSKTRERKACLSETSTGATSERTYAADWERELVTHYTGIGTEVRESYSEGTINETKVVANMPKGLGRYGVENATAQNVASDFEWYLKNHLGSTMLVYATGVSADGSIKAAYDYRAFGEQITLSKPTEKVTENFTGKERDDETALNYFGARYQDPMIGLWMSVDPARQFSSPYLYVGNGVNPVNGVDLDGNKVIAVEKSDQLIYAKWTKTLSKDNAAVVYRAEKSDVEVYFHAVNGRIPTTRLDKNYNLITAAGETKAVNGERRINVTVAKSEIDDAGIHEFIHVDQVLDVIGNDPSKTGSDWNEAYNSDPLFYELDAYGRTGYENITEDDLKDMGY